MSKKGIVNAIKSVWPGLLFAVIAPLSAIPVTGEDYEYETPGQVVAVGDINGASSELVALLQQVGVVDQKLNWTGGNSHLVSLGNLTGPGDRSGRTIEMFMKLEQQAADAGGRVHLVLGDQELALLEKGVDAPISDGVRTWLLQRPLVIKINKKIYAHGGISDRFVGESLSSLNERAHQELGALSEPTSEHSVLSDEGPLRYSGTALCHPYTESFNIERFLKRVGAKQYVTGHVPTDGQVMSRMNGMVILLDTGLAEGGRASVLLDTAEDSHVQYLGSTGKSFINPQTRQLSRQLSGMDDSGVEAILRNGQVTDVKDIGTGITKPWRITQLKGTTEHLAVFKYLDTHPRIVSARRYNARKHDTADRFVYEVAAYKLDRLLDMQLVPAAIVTTVKGKRGVLQDWIDNAINERDRLKHDVAFSGPCKKNEQYRLRIVFDILIHNDDRNLTNIIWTKKDFKMMFIDHTRAFRSTEKRPKQYRNVTIRVSDLLAEKLQSLNKDNLTAELGSYLHPRQIEAIIARRDLILGEMESTGSYQ